MMSPSSTAIADAPTNEANAPPRGRLIVSAGMESSGSGWWFNMTNDLLVAAGCADVRELREKHDLHDILHHQNCSNNVLAGNDLARLRELVDAGHSFVIKTHKKPTPELRQMISEGSARATYIYRDPRDVVVSAFERGRKRRARGKRGAFARLRSMNLTLLWMRFLLLPRYEAWRRCPGTLLLRYEDLRADAAAELERLAGYLEIAISRRTIDAIVERYAGENARQQTGAHYRAGGGRRQDALTPAQQRRCRRWFGRALATMGYEESEVGVGSQKSGI